MLLAMTAIKLCAIIIKIASLKNSSSKIYPVECLELINSYGSKRISLECVAAT